MSTFARQLITFYSNLVPPILPAGFGILHPQPNPDVKKVVKLFYQKFFADNHRRKLILGINPGRFGAGITGVNFTAPRQLKEVCGIEHSWSNSSELSAEFIYEMIGAYGGPARFYHDYFIGSVSPLGFIKDGKNINYYDDKKLQAAVTPFIIETIRQQLAMGFETATCFCIGGEKNFKFLSLLNKEYSFFEKIVPLPHPRFIMQYRRRTKEVYINEYIRALHSTDNKDK